MAALIPELRQKLDVLNRNPENDFGPLVAMLNERTSTSEIVDLD